MAPSLTSIDITLLQTQGDSVVPDTKVFYSDPTFYTSKRKQARKKERKKERKEERKKEKESERERKKTSKGIMYEPQLGRHKETSHTPS